MVGLRPAARAGLLERAWRRWTAFHDVTVLVAHSRDPIAIETPVELRPVDPANVADASAMEPPARIEEFRGFLARGDIGYYGYLDGRVVHRSWVRLGPVRVPLWRHYGTFAIAREEGWIHYCETAPEARGRRAYSAALTRIAQDLGGRAPRGFWIGTEAANAPSIRGIERAGFVFVRRFRIRVRFGFGTQSESPLPGGAGGRA